VKHVSPAIAGDLSKLHPDHASEIRRVAGSDMTSTTTAGANRPVSQVEYDAQGSSAQRCESAANGDVKTAVCLNRFDEAAAVPN
jgi:hypothetical protein